MPSKFSVCATPTCMHVVCLRRLAVLAVAKASSTSQETKAECTHPPPPHRRKYMCVCVCGGVPETSMNFVTTLDWPYVGTAQKKNSGHLESTQMTRLKCVRLVKGLHDHSRHYRVLPWQWDHQLCWRVSLKYQNGKVE